MQFEKHSNETFFQKVSSALKKELPFVLYSDPGTLRVKGAFSRSDALLTAENFSGASGFVFAPFSKGLPEVFFPYEECELFSTKLAGQEAVSQEADAPEGEGNTEQRRKYLDLLRRTLSFMETGGAEKIVISRSELSPLGDPDIASLYKRMVFKYKAFVYCWYHPGIGLWMGASPECFLSVTDDHFSTMSLAGTQAFKGSVDVVWESKEREEQQYVTDYILNRLESLGEGIESQGPFTVRAGGLLHLRTDISGRIRPSVDRDLLVKMLHPTPAICGVPQQEAQDFILANEGYDRKYYTGYLGEMNIGGRTSLYVNLRCLELEENGVRLYVGGGITVKSVPEKEWEETVFKSQVMKRVL